MLLEDWTIEEGFLEEGRIMLSLKYGWILVRQEEGKTVNVKGMM